MDEEIITKIYTQFVNKWNFKPNVLFLNNIVNYEKLENSPIDLYIIIKQTNDWVLKTILLNAENTWINTVYLVFKDGDDVPNHVTNPKIHNLIIKTNFEINVSDIFDSFKETSINVLINDYVVLDYNNILNLYYISPTDLGILSPHIFNEVIPNSVNSFKAFSYQPDTLISDISGIVIRGKPRYKLNYYLFEGFQNLIVETMNANNYNISNISLMTECYLIQKQQYTADNYITKHFNINFPLIFATFTKFDDISKSTELILSYEKLYNELHLPPTSSIDYTLFYGKQELQTLDISSQIELKKLKEFFQYKLYEEHNAKRELFLKNSMRELEKDKNILMTKIHVACLNEKEKLTIENSNLRKKLNEDLENDINAKYKALEKKYKDDYDQKSAEFKLYAESTKANIDAEINKEFIKKNEELVTALTDKKMNEFNALQIMMDVYRNERISEIDTYIKETYIDQKTKDVNIRLEEYAKEKEIEIDSLKEKSLIETKKKINEYTIIERENISKSIRQEYLDKYQEIYSTELDLLNNKLSEIRKNAMNVVYSDVNIIKNDMLAEIKIKRSTEIENTKNYVENYKTRKLKEINEELENNKEYGMRISKLNMDIELAEYADEKRKEIDNEIDEYKIELQNNAYQSSKIHREAIIQENEKNISEYKERRILVINNEVSDYSKKLLEEKTQQALNEVSVKIQELENQYNHELKVKFANKYSELDSEFKIRKKNMSDSLDFEIIDKRKMLYSELESEITNAKTTGYDKINNELILYNNVSCEKIKIEHETTRLKLLQQLEDEHDKLKHDMLEKLRNDIYSQQTEIENQMREVVSEKYAEERKICETTHLRDIETLHKQYSDKIEEIRKVNKKAISDFEDELLSNKKICVERYAKEKKEELLNLERNAILIHNKTTDDLKQTLYFIREMELKNIKEECANLKDQFIKEIKLSYEKENKKYLDEERVKVLENLASFTEDSKRFKLNEIEAYAKSTREEEMNKLHQELETFRTTKLNEVEEELQKYRQEQQREIISRFSNLKNTS